MATRIQRATPADLMKLADVGRYGNISVLEYDIPKSPRYFAEFKVPVLKLPVRLIPYGDQWQDLLQTWLRRGAKLELFIQRLDEKRINMLNGLQKPKGSRLNVHDFSNVPEARGIPLDNLRTRHFALFHRPTMQLWTERKHAPGKPYMENCFYNRENFGGFNRRVSWKEEFNKSAELLEAIKKHKECKPLPIK